MRTADGEQLTDQINMVIVELSKLYTTVNKPAEALTSFEKWSLFFRFADVLPTSPKGEVSRFLCTETKSIV